MKNLCLAPWNHIQINGDGVINPCCAFSPTIYNKKYDSLQDAFDGIENDFLRKRMLKDEKIASCEKCNMYENLNKFSYRMHFNKKYDRDTIKNPKIRELELSLDNTCNFKCVTCSSRFSSRWFNDDKLMIKHGFSRHSNALLQDKQVINNSGDLNDLDLSELNYLKIIGGEPFINIKYLTILKNILIENTDLAIITNNSVFPVKWLDTILRSKSLRIFISIDGVYDTGEFVRYGMNFNKFTKNLLKWKKIEEECENVSIVFNFVTHSMNVLNLKNTIKYLEECGFPIEVDEMRNERLEVDFLKEPSYLNISYLPDTTKKMIEEKLDFNLNGKRDMIVNFMYSHKFRINECRNFKKYVLFLSQFRNKEISKDSEDVFNSVCMNLR
jgi:molybdenum cofactor biosynthesis enzyme MoaA